MRLKIIGKKRDNQAGPLTVMDDWKFVDSETGEELRGVCGFKIEGNTSSQEIIRATLVVEIDALEVEEAAGEAVDRTYAAIREEELGRAHTMLDRLGADGHIGVASIHSRLASLLRDYADGEKPSPGKNAISEAEGHA